MSDLPCEDGVIRSVAAAPAKTRAGVWVLAATILGSSMVFIDGTVVNVALSALQTALNATVTDVQWVVEAYALFLAALLLVGGSLGDLYGRRKVFLVGVVLFAGASAGCGFAPDIRMLIVARGLQGVGGALLVPGSLALISSSFCAEERGRAIGTWSGFTAMTAALGPVLGWLADRASLVAVGIFYQRAVGCVGGGDLFGAGAGESRREDGSETGWVGCCAGDGWIVRDYVWAD